MTGPALIRAMQAAGLTSRALAARLSVSPRTVEDWRQGRRQPGTEVMRRAIKRALRRASK